MDCLRKQTELFLSHTEPPTIAQMQNWLRLLADLEAQCRALATQMESFHLSFSSGDEEYVVRVCARLACRDSYGRGWSCA